MIGLIVLIIGIVVVALGAFLIYSSVFLNQGNTNSLSSGIMFFVMGCILVYYSIKKIFFDAKMSAEGQDCFGLVKNVIEEDENLFCVEVALYLQNEDKVEVTSQMVSSPFRKYNKGDFVIARYCDREAVIKNKILVDSIPLEIQKKFFTKDTLKTTDRVTNYTIKPMDMPENGTTYSWKDNNKNNNNGLY